MTRSRRDGRLREILATRYRNEDVAWLESDRAAGSLCSIFLMMAYGRVRKSFVWLLVTWKTT